jgi:glycogen synthase
MRVLMLGWEFPPHISGGLGTACYGMTKALDEIDVEVCFVLPTAIPVGGSTHVALRGPGAHSKREDPTLPAASSPPPTTTTTTTEAAVGMSHVRLHQVPAILQAYATPETYREILESLPAEQRVEALKALGVPDSIAETDSSVSGDHSDEIASIVADTSPAGHISGAGAHYEGDLLGQVHRYARLAVEIARTEQFDVIHAHDWMTYPAGLAVAAATHKPLLIHVHSTEFDRSGETPDQRVYDIERAGMHGADRVVCVSYLTRNIVLRRYDTPPEKVDVVYNAVELPQDNGAWGMKPIRQNEKIVLFLGRVTMQKGPEYFLRAAKKVVDRYPNVRFIMAGSGDLFRQCVREVADLKLGRCVTFPGFLRGDDVAKVYRMADLYVMPSVSEPFGIAPLEALSHNVPVIISKQSGVSEVLSHVLKVDFWDVDEMANKMLAVLRHPPLQRTLRQHGAIELRKLSWLDSAKKLEKIYASMVAGS